MLGKGMTLKHLTETIVKARPKQVTLGTHHYIQLAESDLLTKYSPDQLDSLEYILPGWSRRSANLQ